MPNIDEFSKKIQISLGAITLWTTVLVSGTFTLSTIYWNFTALQERVDKRYERLNEFDNKLEERIIHLEEIYSKSEVKELKDELEDAVGNNRKLVDQLNEMQNTLDKIETFK